MTYGETVVRSLTLKTAFYDAHERRGYVRAVEVASRLVDDPTLIAAGRAFLETFTRRDPGQSAGYAAWSALLEQKPEEIAARWLADDSEGAALRDTAPVFVVLAPAELRRLWTIAA